MEQPEKKRGPKPMDTEALKKARSISLTDSEYADLLAKAKEAGFKNHSLFIIKKLKLR